MNTYNPHDAYDVIHKGMSEEDRERLQNDVSAALTKGKQEMEGFLIRQVEKAVSELYSNLTANPWHQVIEENSGRYEFIRALQKQLWKAMMESSPENVGPYRMQELVEAWRKNFPAEWEQINNRLQAAENADLRAKLAFEINLNRNR